MCLNYGTPHRYRLAVVEGRDLPVECHGRDELLAILRQEVAAGVYDDTAMYHPLLALAMKGLAENENSLHATLREPNYPFCDLIQAAALMCGIVNSTCWMPSASQQLCWLIWSDWDIRPDVHFKFWHMLTACWPAEKLERWQPLLERIFLRSGWSGMLARVSMKMEREMGQQVLFAADSAA